jgi:hypothetical protein
MLIKHLLVSFQDTVFYFSVVSLFTFSDNIALISSSRSIKNSNLTLVDYPETWKPFYFFYRDKLVPNSLRHGSAVGTSIRRISEVLLE